MIECEQFTYGLYRGRGYYPSKTDGVDRLLTKDAWDKLTALKEDTVLHWPKQKLGGEAFISCTKILRTKDEFKRDGIYNHTFLIPISAYLEHTKPFSLVERHFLSSRPDTPPQLKPVTIISVAVS